MQPVYMVIVASARGGMYQVYAPNYQVPYAPIGIRDSDAVEVYLRRLGFPVVRKRALKMAVGTTIECFLSERTIGDSRDWKTSLELANYAPPGDARIFLAGLGWATH